MTRDEVLTLCYRVKSADDVQKAKQARYDYLAHTPDDDEVFGMGEMLSMLEDAYILIAEDEKKASTLLSCETTLQPVGASS